MGSYTFKWEHPEANDVYVTGTFDDWGKTQKLDKLATGFFEKSVHFAEKKKFLYKFVVDGNWTTNPHLPTERDPSGIENNVLQESDIVDASEAAISTVGPAATTAALAGAVPKTSEKSVDAPGAFPETPAFETPLTEPAGFSVNPLPATDGPGNPISLKPGEPVPDPSTFTNNTITSGVHDDPELKAADKAAAEPTFSVKPIPATAGAGNPITLAPGEPVPDPSTLTGNTVQSTVKTDEASYNASDALPPAVAPVGATEKKETEVNPQETGLFGVPPVTGGIIPESSLPMGSGSTTVPDEGPAAGILTSTVGAGATTAALAGQVPKEPRGVPDVVTESQQKAHVDPEATANPVAVEEKKELESELKSKIPEEPPTSESGLSTGKIAGAVGGAVAGLGAAAAIASDHVQNAAADASAAAKGAISGTPAAPAEEGVPEVVKESISEAHASPEAAANPEAVKEKEAVEAELASKIKPSEDAGEPAPTITAATTEKAPEPTTELNAPADAPATTAATTESVKPETTDVAAAPTNGTPSTTTGVATESTPATSAATGTPGSKNDEKKKKRRSVFIEKLKKIFK